MAKTMAELREELAAVLNIPQEFRESTEHLYSCKCSQCLDWWRAMGRDPDTGRYGPFTDDEIRMGAWGHDG